MSVIAPLFAFTVIPVGPLRLVLVMYMPWPLRDIVEFDAVQVDAVVPPICNWLLPAFTVMEPEVSLMFVAAPNVNPVLCAEIEIAPVPVTE